MNTTKERVAIAFKEIVCRKSFQKITISDIARECDMTRENFYYHFRDKFDIIRYILENEILNTLPETEDFVLWMRTIILCFEKEKAFYSRIFNEIGKEMFRDNFTPIMRKKIRENVERSMDQSVWNKRNEKMTFVTDFYADAFVEYIFRTVLLKECSNESQLTSNLEFLVYNYMPFVRYEKEFGNIKKEK